MSSKFDSKDIEYFKNIKINNLTKILDVFYTFTSFESNEPLKPWINEHIKDFMKQRNCHHKLWQKDGYVLELKNV